MAEGYPYDKGDRFERPEYYMFSRFGGAGFLRDYAEARTAGADRLKARHAAEAVAGHDPSSLRPLLPLLEALLPGEVSRPSDRSPAQAESTALSPTEAALLGLTETLLRQRPAGPEVGFYLGRFEVTKRLKTGYLKQGHTEDGGPEGPLAHALLQLCCGLHHEATGSLKSLNGLLKLGDLACSDAFAHAGPDALCAALCGLALEARAVERLAGEKGVVW
jgi:hypothetical protein